MRFRHSLACLPLLLATPAWAGDTVLYKPAPAWVAAAPAIDPATLAAGAPDLLRLDIQRRIEGGQVWSYLDTVRRVSSPEVASQIGTVSLTWNPDKGDLIVHTVDIQRGGQHLDAFAAGTRFTVLRREQNLERRELNGELTATFALQGLQIGDLVRVVYSVTAADAALKGRAQVGSALPVLPLRIGFGRMRLSWPVKDDVHVKLLDDAALPATRTVGGYREIALPLPLPKPVDMPYDAPGRYRRPPVIAATTFADWADVSRTMAPLFATDGLIAPGSPLAAEVARIMAEDRTPLGRTERALELTQGKIRYLALGMNGGNYVPQTPAQTWALRYGDCKAKTLMLLAMLRAMGIDAKATLAVLGNGDGLADALPMPGAFNHVLVRANVAGTSLWLDGTASGARLADIADTPALHYVLPLRTAGAALMPIATHADARADTDVALDLDQSNGVDMPGTFRATVTLRGGYAAQLNSNYAQAAAKEKLRIVGSAVGPYLRGSQIADAAVRFDEATGTATVTASGAYLDVWRKEDKRLRQTLDHAVSAVSFAPDRARPAWHDIPVALPGPTSTAYRVRMTLPDGGAGYTLDGDQTLSGTLAGTGISRTTRLAGGVVTVEERVDRLGGEIAASAIPAERARVAVAKTKLLRVVAPADPRYRWDRAFRGAGDPRLQPVEAALAKVIAAAEPDDLSGYRARAVARLAAFDRRGAIADLDRAIGINPSVELYLERARLQADLGAYAAALTDAQAALALDPASSAAIYQVAQVESWQGKTAPALALVEERIALGGREASNFRRIKGQLQADGGDTPGAIATLDAALVDKPGDPSLLNERCWIKGTRNTALDTALKDCTRAIELSENSNNALDSRAMVYFRMGRTEEALADLDAVLDDNPGTAGSRFLRGVILKRSGKVAQGEADLRIARLLSPQIDRIYKAYGVVA